MNKVFVQILNMSFTASYVILIVIVARILLKKVPKVFSYLIWAVVLFRLICPFSFESVLSLMPSKTQTLSQNISYVETPQLSNTIITGYEKDVSVGVAPMIQETNSTGSRISWWVVGEGVWLLGIGVLLLYSILSVIKLSRKLKYAQNMYKNVYEMKGISTPFVFGIIRPRIYLPVGITDNERHYIIKHEQTHIKRLDHIIKPFSFFIVCLHWFNPLVWVAFFLMVEDMELSCDESVIKHMGSSIKKEYSNSLLSFSTGRRIIGGCPLAFGENNTKGRIINVLNYKKPGFWVVIVAIVIVVAMSIGLITNPYQKKETVESYARQFIEDEIKQIEKSVLKIVDSKITRLEKMDTITSLLPYPIELWHLEYRLKPDDLNKVILAGGMNEIDGWITEDGSMGKPILIISYNNGMPKYLGYVPSGERDLSTIANRETALRIFLEKVKLLPPVTYSGNHIVVKFPLSTGETSQLLLSQPVVQGELGIWCVERWMDGEGSIYYETPSTDISTLEYYKELQKQSVEGHNLLLLDPLSVALEFINKELGQYVSASDLIIEYKATIDDFLETPESYYIGYISNFNISSSGHYSGYFHLDKIEWLTSEDRERLKQLGIDSIDMPNGYYIHNPEEYTMWFGVYENTQYQIINWGENIAHKSVTMDEFINYLQQYIDFTPPFRIITKNGYVQSIIEQYIP